MTEEDTLGFQGAADEIKKKFFDQELLHGICQSLKGKPAMVACVTLAGMLGVIVGDNADKEEQLGQMVALVGQLCVDAAITTFRRKNDKPSVSTLQ